MKKRAPNGAGTLYKEEGPGRRPRWVSEAYVNLPDGRRRRVRGRGDTPEAAIVERYKRVAALEDANPPADRLTVAQLAERWVEARRTSWRASTLYSYEVSLRLHILPELGGARVVRVTPFDAQRVILGTMRRSSNKHVAAANRARRVMHAMFAFAQHGRIIRDNPVDGTQGVRAPSTERGWWTRSQALAFLVAADRSPYRDLFHAALVTGLRMGELLALQWVDVGAAGVRVRRTFSRHAPGRVQESPKTRGSARTVPVPPGLADRLEARRGPPGGLVFPARNGGILNPSNVNRALRAYAKKAEVPVIKFHDCRRTYASLLAEAGYHPSVIQRHLGHATPELALRVYTSVSAATLAGAVVDLDAGGSFGGSALGLPGPSAAPGAEPVPVDVAPDTLN